MTNPAVTVYPTSLDTVASLMQVINNFATTLTSSINTSQTAIQVTSSVGLQAPGCVSIGTEVIYYASIVVGGGPTYTLTGCIRGFDGTTASSAAAGTLVEQRWVAVNHNLLASAIAAIELALGIGINGDQADLATLLGLNLPAPIAFPSPTTNWSFTHDRERIVNVQAWRYTGVANTFELMDINIEQVVNTGGPSNVNITLGSAESGYVIIS